MLKEFILIVILLFLFIRILIKLYSLLKHDEYNEKADFIINDNFTLIGGDAITLEDNKGISSYCEIDGDKFIKYYFEPKNNTIYNKQIINVIKNNVLESKYLYEKEMMEFIEDKNIKGVNIPKIYREESHDIEYDEKIYKKILKSMYNSPDKIQLKKLTIEYLPYNNLIDYFNNSFPLPTEESKTINREENKTINREENKTINREENNGGNTIITIYEKIFEIIMKFIKNDILPYDIENATNILINPNDNITLYNIDVPFFRIIQNRPKNITDKDIFISLLYEFVCVSHVKSSKNLFYYWYRYNDIYKNIIHDSLKNILSEEEIKIFTSHDYEYMRTKEKIIRMLLKHNGFMYFDLITLMTDYLFDNDKFNKIKDDLGRKIKGIKKNKKGDSLKLNDIKYPSGIKLFIEYAVNNYKMFDYKEICFAFFYFSRTEMETYKEIIKNIIKKDNNKKITLYYNQKSPLIGYDIKFEKSDMKEITTNNYLILQPFFADCSYIAYYIGFSYQFERYFNDGFAISGIKKTPHQYFIYDNVI